MREIPGAWRRTAQGAGLLSAEGAAAPTIFAEMSALAAQSGAINLGQGFPDEDGPAAVIDAARAAIADGRNQYAPGRGQPSYDKQFLRDYLSTLDWNKQPPPPPLPAEILSKTKDRYEEALRLLTR